MSSLSYKRLFFLAGLAASFCAAVFLVRQAMPGVNAHRDGKMTVVSAQPVLPVQPVVGLASASTSQKASTAPVSASVRQILPKLERPVSDWREYQPQKMTIAPYGDLALEFEMTSVRQEGGRTIWRGRNALSGAFLVTVATQNEWHAVLEIPAASGFEFHISGQAATVTEKNATVLCGSERLGAEAAAADMTSQTLSVSPGNRTDSSTADANTVDVLFFYDAATFAASGSNAQLIETTIVASLEAANGVLQNSAVNNLRWHYVAAYQVPTYATTDKLQDDLNLISNSSNAVGQFVSAKVALHGVDQSVLFVGSRRKDNYDGLAWVPDVQGTVAHNSAVVWNSGYVILAHELAHNFGCHHDRQTEGAVDGNGKYSYGFNFKLNNGQDVGTVMSYTPTRVPFFSNPDVSYEGIALGVADDQPKAADNSRVLRENARLMAGCRNASEAPIIVAQPQSATVSHGEGFTLTVTAAGSSLSFQWRKNGVDLPGANGAVYSKSSASATDEGVYNVVVSNDVGQASSISASVAVASPSASPSTSSTSGGSGGGGAVEPWVLLAFAALGSLRLIGRARRSR
jgi:hypothetical protein